MVKKCKKCDKTHYAKGLCRTCYITERRKNPEERKKYNEYQRDYAKMRYYSKKRTE